MSDVCFRKPLLCNYCKWNLLHINDFPFNMPWIDISKLFMSTAGMIRIPIFPVNHLHFSYKSLTKHVFICYVLCFYINITGLQYFICSCLTLWGMELSYISIKKGGMSIFHLCVHPRQNCHQFNHINVYTLPFMLVIS